MGRPTAVAILAVPGLTVAASGIGFIFQVILAGLFGVDAAVDGYLFSISMPTFAAALVASALSYTLTPALVRIETDPEARAALFMRAARWVAVVAVVFALLGLPAGVLQPLSLPPGSPLLAEPRLKDMIMLGWSLGGAQVVVALFAIELNARRRPILSASLALAPNLGAIGFLSLTGPNIVNAPAGVLFGTVVAAAVGALMTKSSVEAKVTKGRAGPSLSAVLVRRAIWTLLAMSCFSAYAVIDAFWAPRVGNGVLASLGYAQRIVIGIGGLVVTGPSAILVPRFAARLRDSGFGGFSREVVRAVALVGLLAVLGAGFIAVFSSHLIGFAFGRGAFGPDDVNRVAVVLNAMLPGFCFMLMSVILTRALFCLEKVEPWMAAAGLGWSVLYFICCGMLSRYGGIGFGASYSVAWFFYLIFSSNILYLCRKSVS